MKVAVADLETDPFEAGQMVRPFLSGLYDGSTLSSWWRPDCVAALVTSLDSITDPLCIYMHNGGRFDFYYFLPHLSVADLSIINGRIVKAQLGRHQLRDSYAIMPFPLSDYDKEVIDYDLMRASKREAAREEIMRYFRRDLTSLYELVSAFHQEFGDKLTIGSTSMAALKRLHEFQRGSGAYDAKFRKQFYFGGRNQVFRGGVSVGDIRVLDVNSMYPKVMRDFLHPVGVANEVDRVIGKKTCFVVAEGLNYGAFPTRREDGSLDFTVERGTFSCSIHEWQAAEHTGTFRPRRILKTWGWPERGSFDRFVDHYYHARAAAKASDDLIRVIFYKYILNSAYGKFAQCPDNYSDWYLTRYGDRPRDWHECSGSCELVCLLSASHNCSKRCILVCPKVWTPAYVHDGEYMIWQRPLQQKFWYNVATGASITGASRAVLLYGIASCPDPLYCDTDSVITRGAAVGLEIDALKLGAWKEEGRGTFLAIAGKKKYVLCDPGGKTVDRYGHPVEHVPGAGYVVKRACNGARLTGAQLLAVARGGSVQYENPVPVFKWDGTYSFTSRTVRRTGVCK